MKKYETYKDIGLQWYPLGVPSHWGLMRHKNVLTEHKELVGKNANQYTLLSLTLNGVIIRDLSEGKGKFSKDYDKYVVVNPGDFVFCLFDVDETPRTVGLSRHRGMITGAYDIFTPQDINSEYFYYYYLALDNIKALKPLYSGLRKVIPYPSFMATKFPVPPREEQEQIVRYLDWQVSQINHLIHGYQKQIELLEERRQTIINRAVTQGISTNVQYKDSGVNWIPQIPEHWNMVYSKKLFAQRKDKAFPNDIQLTSSQKYGIISQDEFMKREGRRLTVVMTGSDILKHVGIGDFVISMRSFQGGLEYSYVEGKISSAYVMLIPNKEKVYDEYFKWLLKSKSYIKALQGTSDLVRDGQALRYANFAKVYLPEIPLKEQKAIADYITSEVSKIDNALPTFQKKIELLREYRTRLISDVVTGQIDVRDMVIPDYIPEEDIEIDIDDADKDLKEVVEDAE